MADLTPITLSLNDGVAWTKTAGAASQTMVYDRRDEGIFLLIENGDAADCRVKFTAAGAIGNGQVLNVDVAAGEFAIAGPLETNRFLNSDGKVTVQILDQDDTAFSGTVANVLLTQVNNFKSLVD